MLKKNMWGIIVLALCVILSHSAIGVDSTDRNDYYFYDDFENMSYYPNNYVVGTKLSNASNTTYEGTGALSYATGDAVTCNSYINTSRFDSAEYSSPYCLDFYMRVNGTSAANVETGIVFNTWANFLTSYNPVISASNITFADNANYHTAGPVVPINGYQRYTTCFLAGYAAAGTTNITVLVNGTQTITRSTVARSSLQKICFQNRVTNSITNYDNIRIWNYTKYGTTPPQAADPGQSSCTYNGTPTWYINLADQCNISTAVTVYPNATIINGTGRLRITNGGSITTRNLSFTPNTITGLNILAIELGGSINVKN